RFALSFAAFPPLRLAAWHVPGCARSISRRRSRVSPPKKQQAGAPKRWQSLAVLAGAVVLVVGFGVVLSVIKRSDSSGSGGVVRGLPRTPDYHSLLVSPTDPRRLVLGTHYG